MNLTPTQQAAISHRGSNLLLAASAGSGKTEVLARRCASLVADAERPCDIDRLLVVTFTRAAAAELRVRVSRFLREEAAEAGSPQRRAHLRRQEILVDAAEIGTIDAWCGRVVREHFDLAGVDVNFGVLSEQEGELLRSEVLDAVFDELYRSGDALGGEFRDWLGRACAPDDQFLRRLVRQLNGFREHLVNPEPWLERCSSGTDAAGTASVLAGAVAEECRFQQVQLAAILDGSSPEAAAIALEPYQQKLGDWAARLGDAVELPAVVAEIEAFRLPKARKSRNAAPEPAVVGDVRKRWLEGRLQKSWSVEQLQAMLDSAPAAAALTGTLQRLEQQYHERLSAAKRQRAQYEFGDVLRMTLDLLGTPGSGAHRTPTPVARRLQARYAHVLVDEFQDTSPVQVEILRLVTRDADGGNRFVVGDIKQSIYGFRQAQPDLFREMIDACESGAEPGRVLYLSDNFRSHARLLAGLNGLFAPLFDRDLGGTPFGPQERLAAGRTEVPNPAFDGQPRIQVQVLEAGAGETPVPPESTGAEGDEAGVERIELEAQLAVTQIRQWLDAGLQIPERRQDGAVELRPLRLGDIVVLLRSARHAAGLVAQVVRANGIRCVASGKEGLLDVVEVRDVCTVLRLLVNRRQDVPLAAYLRGPCGGLDEADLLAIRAAADPEADFLDAAESYAAGGSDAARNRRLRAALERLDRWTEAARDREAPEVLRRIFGDTALPLFAQGLRGGAQRVAFLRTLQTLAADSRGHGSSVADFVAFLESLTEEEIDLGALAGEDDDVVRVMTIHAAKGLEFPVVFLLGTGNQFNTRRRSENLRCDETIGVGLRFYDYPSRRQLLTARYALARAQLARRELEEELRLLYVATTRARERLHIVGHAGNSAWSDIGERLRGQQSIPLVSRLSVGNRLEWVLMAAAAGHLDRPVGDQPPLVGVETVSTAAIRLPEQTPGERVPVEERPTPAEATSTRDDEAGAWIARAVALLQYQPDYRLAGAPAVLSVSAAKELATRGNGLAWGDRDQDRPPELPARVESLAVPAFAAEQAEPEGRAVGTACHRFMERADLRRLGDAAMVRQQIDEITAAGVLSPQEAALVPADDVAWFANTPAGLLLSRQYAAVQREVPFVYAWPLGVGDERTIVRGIIDCLVDTPGGLVLLDYKTDRPPSDRDLADRVAGYTVQLQLYARAAADVFSRPVSLAALVFLRARQVIEVPTGTLHLATSIGPE